MPRIIATLGPGDIVHTATHTYYLILDGGVFCYSDGEHRPMSSGYSFEEIDHLEVVRRFSDGARVFDASDSDSPPGLWAS